jgi:hypothetical protein
MQRRAFLTTLGLGAAAGGAAIAKNPYNDFAKPPGDTPSGGADLDRWKQALAGARLYAITRLREYSAAGRFPRNHRIFGRVPTFIDARNTPCAVGYLMQRSGHGALARTIAATNNNVYIERIEEGPALDWILFSGLTQSECALIQPSYNWRPPRPVPEPPPDDEPQRLREHFARVHTQLLDHTTASLGEAVSKLEPLIAAGASIDRVAR